MKNLFILPFDHRTSMLRDLGIRGKPSHAQKKRVTELKQLIFEAFKLALARGAPRDSAAILVDAEFGAEILREAKRDGIIIAMPVEKSETRAFELEPGFQKLVKKFKPDFVKALVRFNPAPQLNKINAIQLARLKRLSDFLKKTRREFLLELLVPPTSAQLKKLWRKTFDSRLRPQLALQAMKTMQDYVVEPSVWKIEGVQRVEQQRALVNQARAGGRNARLIVLGRGESEEQVRKWLEIGARVSDVAGFAVGRTVFAEPLREFAAGKIGDCQAVERMAENFLGLLRFWANARARVRARKKS